MQRNLVVKLFPLIHSKFTKACISFIFGFQNQIKVLGLDIVTNKVMREEMSGIPHHLMSFYEPAEAEYNVQQFRKSALELIDDIWKRDKLPIIVGGTSYYIEGILFCQNLIETDPEKSGMWKLDIQPDLD